MIAKIVNGVVTQWPLGEMYIRTEHPNVSFAFPLDDKTLNLFGFAKFVYSDPPNYDPEFQEAKETTPIYNGKVVTQQWQIVEKYSEQEKAEYIVKKQTQELEAATVGARIERNALLSASDWTQIADAPVDKTAWATYRQALRDIPTQAGFPNNITWPVKPE